MLKRLRMLLQGLKVIMVSAPFNVEDHLHDHAHMNAYDIQCYAPVLSTTLKGAGGPITTLIESACVKLNETTN